MMYDKKTKEGWYCPLYTTASDKIFAKMVYSFTSALWMIMKQHSPWLTCRTILLERPSFPWSIMSVPLEARFFQQHKLYLPLKDLSPQLFAQLDTLSFCRSVDLPCCKMAITLPCLDCFDKKKKKVFSGVRCSNTYRTRFVQVILLMKLNLFFFLSSAVEKLVRMN